MPNNDYDGFELAGEAREQALARCRARLAEWGLTMPDVTPVVFHFGLNDFYTVGEIEFWIANEKDAGYCGKFLFVFDGQTCPYHHHDRKHETFFILKGRVRMRIDEAWREFGEGSFLPMPPGLDHSFTGQGDAILLEVSSPCLLQDNFFENKGIGEAGVI